MLEVRGYDNGFCFMFNGKDMSVHELLLANGKKFHKATINALPRKNLPNEEMLKAFEEKAAVLHTGLSAESARALLLQHFAIDVKNTEYYALRASEIQMMQKVYELCKYKVPAAKDRQHSPMYYFHRYLNK